MPALGDFASRRLDPLFLEVWDQWLSSGLLALRTADPEVWLENYLASPSWRFVLMPGVLPNAHGDHAWAGTLVPSVDRSGRYFPFSIIQGISVLPSTIAELTSLLEWLTTLEDVSIDALNEDWDTDRVEAELARHPVPSLFTMATTPQDSVLVSSGTSSRTRVVAGASCLGLLLAADAAASWTRDATGQSFWFSQPEQGQARWVATRGLPQGASFSLLFGSNHVDD